MTWAEWIGSLSVADVSQFVAIGWIARELFRVTMNLNSLGADVRAQQKAKKEA